MCIRDSGCYGDDPTFHGRSPWFRAAIQSRKTTTETQRHREERTLAPAFACCNTAASAWRARLRSSQHGPGLRQALSPPGRRPTIRRRGPAEQAHRAAGNDSRKRAAVIFRRFVSVNRFRPTAPLRGARSNRQLCVSVSLWLVLWRARRVIRDSRPACLRKRRIKTGSRP